ncbi:tetratricopeptide repeat protein [Aureispira anguillae]|uniref:Tetratricopeptide repeat protein n=1 Tax=Aureispira anguillae TaxID=2864201 RepID=A0A916DX79_9BACT|nr:hypothetical protein [Aureispira anguillae]BDS15597.1 hypothetical protein AsAng_0063810 [Aureispira anguillae]
MKYLFFILNLFFTVSLFGQDEVLPNYHQAYKQCNKVYKNLKLAVGDQRENLPKLLIMNRKKRVAAYRGMDNTIIIEKAAYDICRTMGENEEAALAFLIGHELTHFYQQTDWKRRLGETHFLLKHEQLKKYAMEDEEADSYSAFIAYLANYKTLEIIPSLLEKIYEGYQLDNDLEGYPTLEERKRLVAIIQRKVRKFIQLYETANYYIAIGWNLQAYNCYTYLLKFLKTKEIYHNIGVVSLAAAIEQPEDEGYAFLYPIDIDLTNVFQRPLSVAGSRNKLLREAEVNLKKALNLDKKYCSAYLNLSCVYDLKGDPTNALTTLNTASNLSPTNLQRAKIAIIKGIVYAHRDQIQTASKYFDDANRHYQNLPVWYISNTNKRILSNEKNYKEQYHIVIEDRMDQVNFRSMRYKSSKAIVLGANSLLNLEIDFSTQAHSYVSRFFLKNETNGKISYAFLQRTRNKTLTTQTGIKVGDALSKVQKAYEGTYFQVVHHHQGFFLVYPSKGLIFQINAHSKVREWAIFAEY